MNRVNRLPLTPLTLLERTVRVFPKRTATVYGETRHTFAEYGGRVARLANALLDLGLSEGGKVGVLAPNIPMVLEAHYGIPWAGGVIVAVNTRLNGHEVAHILDHSQAEVLLVDRDLLEVVRPVLGEMSGIKHIIVADDTVAAAIGSDKNTVGPDDGWRPEGALDYEALLAESDPTLPPIPVHDEEAVIAIDYTSGTTGTPKGVMYSHRGAMLNALSDALQHRLSADTVYLWTLPMFHCNGWCFSWAAPGLGATSVCLRQTEPRAVRDLIVAEGVTLFCGAPIVLQMLASLAETEPFRFDHVVRAGTGGAPPSPTLLAAMRDLNVDVTHLYGLTETYGPITICEVQEDWLGLSPTAFAEQMARQGVGHPLAGELAVLDEKHHPVPADAQTMGEICMRGHTVMEGYYRDEEATAHAFRGGWFHSGDLAVLHPDGYVEVRDRSKDIIISGGENISTIEVENTLAAHPDIEEAAVVSRPDGQWGEVPVAFVNLKSGKTLSEEAVIEFCRERLAHFKCPKTVIFEPLPRTSTGKVQKFSLRERMWQGQDGRVKG